MDIHKLSDGEELGSVTVVLSSQALAAMRAAAEATGRTAEDLATCAVEEELLRWARGNQPLQFTGTLQLDDYAPQLVTGFLPRLPGGI